MLIVFDDFFKWGGGFFNPGRSAEWVGFYAKTLAQPSASREYRGLRRIEDKRLTRDYRAARMAGEGDAQQR